MTILSVFRYNKKAKKVEYKQYEAPKGTTTVLQALKEIQKLDPTLGFRHSCGSGKCGACAMTINGKQQLACKTLLTKEDMTVEPLKAFPVVKDLIVDMTRFWRQFEATKPWLLADPNKNIAHTPDEVRQAMHLNSCIQCGACTSACALAKDQTFLGPAAATTLYRFIADPKDIRTKERIKLATDHGLWSCVKSFACTDACPVGIDPSQAIQNIRQMAHLYGVAKSHPGAKMSAHFADALIKYGTVDEMKVALSAKMLPFKFSLSMELAKQKRLPPKDITPNEAARDLQQLFRGKRR